MGIKRFQKVLMVLCAGMLAWCFQNQGAQAKVINLRLGHYTTASNPINKGAMMFAKNVERRTNGQVKITVYPANALGSPPEQLEDVRLGTLDMSINTQGQTQNYVKASATAQIPFLFTSYKNAHRTLDGPAADWLGPKFEKAGFILLANWEWGFRNITNNVRPINKPSDLKGLKIRVPPEFHLQTLFKALGANVTTIAWPELYMALAQHVVDGQENPIAAIYYQKFYEVQKYLAITHHTYSCSMLLMSKKTWNKLTAWEQFIIREEAQRAGNWVRKTMDDEEPVLIKKMEKAGMKVTYPNIALFRKAAAPADKIIFARWGEKNVEKMMKFAKECR